MDKQLLFCVETNKRANTDYIYIKETLDFYYEYDNHKVSIKPIYMRTKTKYNSKVVQKEIADKRKAFKGETIVIYCIDTDCIDKEYEVKALFDNINNYCKVNNYELAWFCIDVEDVYLGKQVSDKQKVNEAAKFRNNKTISSVPIEHLNSNKCKRRYSNILSIIDQYLKRKNNN